LGQSASHRRPRQTRSFRPIVLATVDSRIILHGLGAVRRVAESAKPTSNDAGQFDLLRKISIPGTSFASPKAGERGEDEKTGPLDARLQQSVRVAGAHAATHRARAIVIAPGLVSSM